MYCFTSFFLGKLSESQRGNISEDNYVEIKYYLWLAMMMNIRSIAECCATVGYNSLRITLYHSKAYFLSAEDSHRWGCTWQRAVASSGCSLWVAISSSFNYILRVNLLKSCLSFLTGRSWRWIIQFDSLLLTVTRFLCADR